MAKLVEVEGDSSWRQLEVGQQVTYWMILHISIDCRIGVKDFAVA